MKGAGAVGMRELPGRVGGVASVGREGRSGRVVQSGAGIRGVVGLFSFINRAEELHG
jgi:hypothetical protein